MKKYDLVVFGTGGAAWPSLMQAKQAGLSVAVVNDGPFGGTCSVRGCIPKKVLAGVAEIADINSRLSEMGIVDNLPKYNWKNLIEHKRSFTDPVPPATEKALEDARIDIYRGSPKFVGDLEIQIDGQLIKAEKVLIATGSKPSKLSFDGAEYLITSDDFLELDELPKNIVFVGGGYISFEFAHIASRLGANVTILHGDDRPLPMFDMDIIATLIDATKHAGIKLELNSKVEQVIKNHKNFSVIDVNNNTYEADLVVHGAGRPPAIDEMDLAKANIDHDLLRGVSVNEYLQSTSNKNVYAAGDVAASGPPLSPVATVHGRIVAENILHGNKAKQPNYRSTSSVIFTTPSVGKAGYLEHEANEKGIKFDVANNDLSTWFDSQRLGQNYAKSKILIEKETNKIVGAHIIGNHADDLINIFSLVMELGLTTDQLKKPIFAFPTSSNDLRSMF